MAIIFGIFLLAGFCGFSTADNCLLQKNLTSLKVEVPELFDYLKSFESKNKSGYLPPDTGLDTVQAVLNDGYPIETHNITTADGYILTYHRIPHGKNSTDMTNRPVVLLQHGLFSESTHWVIQNPGSVLAYLLCEAGFDVWLGNARGNRYSRGHVKYTTKDPAYWFTGWTEMGLYDIPAAIDYMLNKTGQAKINYVGHSMGTTMYFVMCSERPEYCAKVNYMIAYGPVGYVNHISSAARALAPVLGLPLLQVPLILAGQGEFFPDYLTGILETSTPGFCNSELRGSISCSLVLFALMGFDYCQMNPDLLPVIMSSLPSSTPTQAMVQYFQEMNCILKPCFQKVDYGVLANPFVYGTLTPPQFNFSKINTPKKLYVGPNDLLATPLDVKNFIGKMPNTAPIILVKFPLFNHIDFLWATDAKPLIYDDTIQTLCQFNNLPAPSN